LNTYILYHKNCLDGLAAAYAFWKNKSFVTRFNIFKDSFIPVQYGSPPPTLPLGSNLYILDFSYSPEVIGELKKLHSSVVVIDHHQTALRLKGVEGCHIDTTECGSMLAFKYARKTFSGIKKLGRFDVPMFLEYINDHDLWLHKKPHCEEFVAAIRSYPLTIDAWDEINVFSTDSVHNLVLQGRHVLRYQSKIVRRLTKTAFLQKIDGHLIPTVYTDILRSEVCNELLKNNADAKAACAISFEAKTPHLSECKVKYSLRSRKGELDVAKIAEKYGGGGHQSAAGFALNKDGSCLLRA
tara:strand:- start:4329 stop:5219 length:891 start_codon:yes stop_codon:yes gene_type:complete